MSKVLRFTRFGGPEHQELAERPVPEPGPGELLVEVRAAGVNPVDWKIRSGRFGEDGPLRQPMGREAAGLVIAVGEGVSGVAVSDAVLGRALPGVGGLAEHTILRAEEAVPKPASVSFADAATIPVAATTAYDLVHQVAMVPGRSVLVVGAGGGVGLAAAQIAAARGLRVIGVAGTGKRALVESTGAAFVASGEGFAARVRALVRDGVDLVIDLVGGGVLREAATLSVEPERVLSAADPSVVELGGATRRPDPRSMARVTDLVARGVVVPHVTARYPLEEADAAIAAVEAGHATGKVVVEVRT